MSVRAILFDLGGTLTRTASLAQSLAELSNSTAINRVKLDRQQLTMFGEKIEQYIGGLYAANQPDQPDWRAVWEAVAGQCAVRLDAEDMEHLCRAHLKQFVNNC